jgi:hypothetical protein
MTMNPDTGTTSRTLVADGARCSGAASLGRYTDEVEASAAGASRPAQRHEAHDD